MEPNMNEPTTAMNLQTALELGLFKLNDQDVPVVLPRGIELPETYNFSEKSVHVDADGDVNIDGIYLAAKQAIQLRDFLTAAIKAGFIKA